MKFIKIAHSKQYLDRHFPNLSDGLRKLILEKTKQITGKNKGHTKSLKNKFFDRLKEKKYITEEIVNEIFNSLGKHQEGQEEIFHPLVTQIITELDDRRWTQKVYQEEINKRPEEELIVDLSLIRDQITEFKKLKKQHKFEDELKDFGSLEEFRIFIKRFKQETDFQCPENLKKLLEEWKVDEINNEGFNIKLYYIKRVQNVEGDKDSIQVIGENTSWCVSKYPGPYTYTPDAYYCFFIDNEPKILSHTSEIKDENDIGLNNYFIKVINPLVEKHKLNQGDGDWRIYNKSLKKCNDIKENIGDNKYIESILSDNINDINLLPIDNVVPYLKKLYDNLDEFSFDGSPKNLLDILGIYVEKNNLDRTLIDEWVYSILLHEPDRYLKETPSSFRSEDSNLYYEVHRKLVKEGKAVISDDDINDKILNLINKFIENGYPPNWAYDWAIKKLNEKNPESYVTDIWIPRINKYIEKNGNAPYWAEYWAKQKLEEKNPESYVTDIWIPRINKDIEKYGNAPLWAYDWVKDNPEKCIEGINKFIEKYNQFPSFFSHFEWAMNKLEEKNPESYVTDIWIPRIKKYIEKNGKAPSWAYYWAKKKLEEGTESYVTDIWIPRINKYIEKNGNGDAPDWARTWAERKLNEKNPESYVTKIWIPSINKDIETYGNAHNWAEGWAKKNPEKCIEGINGYIETYGSPPDWASDWAKNKLEEGTESYVTNIWIPRINKYIEEEKNPPFWAYDWAKDNPEKCIEGINKCIEKGWGDPPLWARAWAKDNPEKCIEGVSGYIERNNKFPIFFNFFKDEYYRIINQRNIQERNIQGPTTETPETTETTEEQTKETTETAKDRTIAKNWYLTYKTAKNGKR